MEVRLLLHAASPPGGDRGVSWFPALEALLWSFTSASDDMPRRSEMGKSGIAIVKASATPIGIRHSLNLQEDSIILGLLERARYCYNSETYDPDAFSTEGFNGFLIEFMLKETEKLHAKVGWYKCPDKHPFFPDDLTDLKLPPLQYPQEPSKRIHYGKYVAEAKFQASPAQYEVRLNTKFPLGHRQTHGYVNISCGREIVKRRVEAKATTFRQEVMVDVDE